ncbi:MATE family efflux transporter [bacterium]|nr:MAG: MATE family efflux transporter [bacterium]
MFPHESPHKPHSKGALAMFGEALTGSSRDLTTEPLGSALFLLAVPMILELLMESIFSVVDIFFVAKLGADAVAVVGLTESLLSIVFALAIGLSVGATAIVSRRIGAGDREGAVKGAVHTLYLGVAVSVFLSVIGIAFAPQLLHALGAQPQVVALGTPFARIMLGSNAAILFLFLLSAIFRGAGDSSVAMHVLFWANLLNIVLAPCFIYGADVFSTLGFHPPSWLLQAWPIPKLGVTGAAVGTTIGRGVGVLLAASYLMRPGGRITIRREHWKLDALMAKSLIAIAVPAILQFTISTLSWSALVRVVADFGSEAIAGYVIGQRLIVFMLLPALGLSNAAATLVGQNLGADQPGRAEAAVWRTSLINALILGVIGGLLLCFSRPLVGCFTVDPTVLSYGASALHIASFGFVFYGFGTVMEAAFNGAGDTWTPTYLNFLVFWVLEIPLAYLLAYRFELGPNGVFWAIMVAFSMMALCSTAVFKRGKWKQKAL